MNNKIKTISQNFQLQGELVDIKENAQGNINTTYLLTFSDNSNTFKYLLQKVNQAVFDQPYLVMRNIELVTNHIKKKLKSANDVSHKTLNFIKTKNNEIMYTYINRDGEKEYYRVYEFIDGCVSYNNFSECANKEEIAKNTGRCFGLFHKLLSDFAAPKLTDTIPNFHNTPKRFEDLMNAIKTSVTDRAFECAEEIVYLISKIDDYSVIWDSLGTSLPIRVTHNDTKLNNVLLSSTTDEGVAVIDLDTVMCGSLLFDIGDGIRSACANSFEDETNPENIFLNLELTKAYLEGYLEEMANELTPAEVKNIGLSIAVLTFELAMRFLTDYVNGDTYFKIKYSTHNKDRFLNQFILLKDIEGKIDEIDAFVLETYNRLISK